MGQTLKVLNAVRHYEVGIPLTYSQSVITFFADIYTKLLALADITMLHLLKSLPD